MLQISTDLMLSHVCGQRDYPPTRLPFDFCSIYSASDDGSSRIPPGALIFLAECVHRQDLDSLGCAL